MFGQRESRQRTTSATSGPLSSPHALVRPGGRKSIFQGLLSHLCVRSRLHDDGHEAMVKGRAGYICTDIAYSGICLASENCRVSATTRALKVPQFGALPCSSVLAQGHSIIHWHLSPLCTLVCMYIEQACIWRIRTTLRKFGLRNLRSERVGRNSGMRATLCCHRPRLSVREPVAIAL